MKVTQRQLRRIIRGALIEQAGDRPYAGRVPVGTMLAPFGDLGSDWVVLAGNDFNGIPMVKPGDASRRGGFEGKPLRYVGEQRSDGGAVASSPGYSSTVAYILEDPDTGDTYWISGDWFGSLQTV
tara:strand:+ start:410 stop:784 length:375 start_codon:yes stop_codon:yes gene_type:complete